MNFQQYSQIIMQSIFLIKYKLIKEKGLKKEREKKAPTRVGKMWLKLKNDQLIAIYPHSRGEDSR
jgi:hypothetical protein